MSKNKIVSTMAFLINNGVTSVLYHDFGKKHKKLEGCNSFWDNDHNLCFTIEGKTYKFAMIKE